LIIYYNNMAQLTKQFLQQQEEKLKKAKEKIEKQLAGFATKKPEAKGGWDSNMPSFNTDVVSLEEEADEVEEFSARLSLENTLETELKKISGALEQIKKGKYGVCTKCKKPIAQGRLRVYPQADTCSKC